MLSRLLVSMTLCAFAFLIRVVAIYLLAVHESDFEGVLQSFLLDATYGMLHTVAIHF